MLFNFFILILISSVKFAFAPAFSVLKYNLGYLETVLITTAGGFLGVLTFAFLTNVIVDAWSWFIEVAGLSESLNKLNNKLFPSNSKSFSKKNRLIIKIKGKYGLIGLAILTPIFLSIPVGTFLSLRYYPNFKVTILYLLLSVAIWSNILTYIILYL
ncbi:MAG: hypothetical protein A2W98_12360 [Bacteroidetes bacterium GWF2_33_38]|nr:MAG: hypothetical protein A2W98_12360 [Bacteroidetes bacterium GWF2_33_38]OFY92144.1 MAG: hypothetical protein A2236_01710 [Bacteroidetes bacterium RIFOXYA2_FULL_33_7]